MIMNYGGFLVCSGTFTNEKTGKTIDWKHIKALLGVDTSRVGVYKIPYSDTVLTALRSLPVGCPINVSFDFYGNVEGFTRVEGGQRS